MCPLKYARPDELPHGFLYRPAFLTEAEEAELLQIFYGLEFVAYDYHGYQAKRRIVRFGVNYDLNTKLPNDAAPPIPEFLLSIRARAAAMANPNATQTISIEWRDWLPQGYFAHPARTALHVCHPGAGPNRMAAQHTADCATALFHHISHPAFHGETKCGIDTGK